MATKKGIWNLQQVRDKQLQSLWDYSGASYLFTWGQNNFGQGGQNNRTAYSSPVQVPGSWSALGHYSGNDSGAFTGGVKTDGTLWSWGYNKQGQLGQNSQTYYSSPVQIPGTTWANLFIGGPNVAFATRTDGTLWAWGYDEWGVLGQNARELEISSPVQIPGTTWGSKFTSDTGSAMAIKTDGTLWSWGYNEAGNLGTNNRTRYSSPVQVPGTTWSVISGGSSGSSGAIKTDGTLWTWGTSGDGVLGLNAPNNEHKSSPTQVGSDTTWSKISTGYRVHGAIKTDGTLWTWGANTNGKLGLNAPDNSDKSSPTQIPGTTWSDIIMDERAGMFAIKTDNTLWAWGYGNYGTLGQNQDGTMRFSSPVQVPGTTWTKFSGVGAASAIAIKNL